MAKPKKYHPTQEPGFPRSAFIEAIENPTEGEKMSYAKFQDEQMKGDPRPSRDYKNFQSIFHAYKSRRKNLGFKDERED